jgi:DNA polymerase II small subunit
MNQEILQFCLKKGILIDKQISNLLDESINISAIKNLIERVDFQYNQKIISKSFFDNNPDKVYELLSNYNGDNRKFLETFFLNLGINIEIFEKNELSLPEIQIDIKNKVESSINLLRIYKNNPKKIEVGDFVKNFKSRFIAIKNILQDRVELENLVSINRIESNKQCSLIAMVYDKKVTKNDNVLLEIEDMTGRVTALINKNRFELYEKSKEILLDEVIGLKVSGSREMIFVNDIIFPDARLLEKKKSKNNEIAAFISDTHVGSDKFLEKNFLKFIHWLNGEIGDENQRNEALKVKYLFITGDTVDGVGVYPGQENQLLIKDVNEQYKKLSELLQMIRKDIMIIMCAGQHDAVRVAEPQPIIGEYYGESLHDISNLYLVTNPALVEIGDVKFKVLMYHGASMHGVINSIEALRVGRAHDHPTQVVKYLLKKRHLAPTHSLVTYTPLDNEDALLISEIPDIVSTGDLHRPEISEYNGILLFAGSCWQSITPFEEKVGNNPDPCKVPIFNLKTREMKILDFSEIEEDKKEGGENENRS